MTADEKPHFDRLPTLEELNQEQRLANDKILTDLFSKYHIIPDCDFYRQFPSAPPADALVRRVYSIIGIFWHIKQTRQKMPDGVENALYYALNRAMALLFEYKGLQYIRK